MAALWRPTGVASRRRAGDDRARSGRRRMSRIGRVRRRSLTIGNGGGTSEEEEQGTVLYTQGPLVPGEKITRCLRGPKAPIGKAPGTLGSP